MHDHTELYNTISSVSKRVKAIEDVFKAIAGDMSMDQIVIKLIEKQERIREVLESEVQDVK